MFITTNILKPLYRERCPTMILTVIVFAFFGLITWLNFSIIVFKSITYFLSKTISASISVKCDPLSLLSHFNSSLWTWLSFCVNYSNIFKSHIYIIHFENCKGKISFLRILWFRFLFYLYSLNKHFSCIKLIRRINLINTNNSSIKWHGIINNCWGTY